MDDRLQSDDLVKRELAELDRMKGERAPWEAHWREIEERVNPNAAGSFTMKSPGARRGNRNFDVTAIRGVKRFAEAMCDITVPEAQQYIGVRFADKDLDKLPEVRRWCEYAGDRLYQLRYASHGMFGARAFEDFMQTGTYGTAPFWVGVMPGKGLYYQTIPLGEVYIDTDFAGMVDTGRRCFKRTARQLEQFFGRAQLSPKMLKALEDNKPNEEFEILHTVRPNAELEPGRMDARGMPVASIYIAIDEKIVMRRRGFYTMPLAVSRHVTSPGEKYGRSPAMDLLPSIHLANAQAQTLIRAGHKAVDPAIAFYSDDGITKVSTRPGGINAGLVNDEGRLLAARMPGGEGALPVGMELLESERAVIDDGFLGAYFKLLTDDKVQRSATAVLEIAAKTGVVVAPYASRYQGEKQNPTTKREYEEALRSGQIEPPPPVVREAGAQPLIEYWNPLQRMARAQEAAGLTRLIETLAPLAQNDPSVLDVINIEEAAPGVAEVLGVRPSWIRTKDEIAAKRAADAEAQAAQATLAGLESAAAASVDLARAGQIAREAA